MDGNNNKIHESQGLNPKTFKYLTIRPTGSGLREIHTGTVLGALCLFWITLTSPWFIPCFVHGQCTALEILAV